MQDYKITRLQDYKITRLQDDLLVDCNGGQGEHDGLVWLGLATSVVSATVVGGRLISRAVKSAKAKKAREKGDFSLAVEYDKSIKKLDKDAIITSGIMAAGLVTMFASAEASNKPSLYVFHKIAAAKNSFYIGARSGGNSPTF